MRFAEEFEHAPFLHEGVTAKHQPSRKLKKVRGRIMYVTTIIDKYRPKYAFLPKNTVVTLYLDTQKNCDRG